jgi:hypothetical protein
MLKMQLILPFLFVLMTIGTPVESVSDDHMAPLNQEFEIRLGDSIWIQDERLKIDFQRVAEDSRCPEGVNCIWAGNGKIALRVTKARRRPATMMLNTMLDPKQSSYRGYEVKLVKLEPHPKKNVRIKKRSYVATLVVTRK